MHIHTSLHIHMYKYNAYVTYVFVEAGVHIAMHLCMYINVRTLKYQGQTSESITMYKYADSYTHNHLYVCMTRKMYERIGYRHTSDHVIGAIVMSFA